MIIINCILLVSETPPTPWDPDPPQESALQIFDWIFTMIFVGEMVIKIIADGVVAHPIFSDREWIMNVSKLDDKEDPKDNDVEYLGKWEKLSELNLMHLQCQDEDSVRRIEGAVVKVCESNDGWIIVQFETFLQEFRMLFRDDGEDESNQWAQYIYVLKERTYKHSNRTFRDESGQEVQRWTPAFGYDDVA